MTEKYIDDIHYIIGLNRIVSFEYVKELEEKIYILRKALAGLIGVESKAQLKEMELQLRAMPGIEEDKIVAINAIHALLKVLEV